LRSTQTESLRYLLHILFFTTPPTTHIYTLSLHDALPISIDSAFAICSRTFCTSRVSAAATWSGASSGEACPTPGNSTRMGCLQLDRKSTRLNSSHVAISYAVFCLKKKIQTIV